jgi:hypothetical protein
MTAPSVPSVRKYLEDYAIKNMKYNDKFFTDDDIQTGINYAILRANALPPVDSGLPGGVLPEYILLMGTISELFMMKYLNATINYAPGINENGINLPIGEEAGVYQAVAERYGQQFEMLVSRYKAAKTTIDSMKHLKSPLDRYSLPNSRQYPI